MGPITPGFVADTGLASQTAEIGVILLMFGVGLHFSARDHLLAVRGVAIPGAISAGCPGDRARRRHGGMVGLDWAPASSSGSTCRSPAPSCS